MNAHLLNAARYLDAVHDIQVDEHHPKLAKLIEKHVHEIDNDTLTKYWQHYLVDIGAGFNELSELSETVEADEFEEKTITYRGREQTIKVKKSDLK